MKTLAFSSRPKRSLDVLLLIFLGGELERQASLDVAFLVSRAERKKSQRRDGVAGTGGGGPGDLAQRTGLGPGEEWAELSWVHSKNENGRARAHPVRVLPGTRIK